MTRLKSRHGHCTGDRPFHPPPLAVRPPRPAPPPTTCHYYPRDHTQRHVITSELHVGCWNIGTEKKELMKAKKETKQEMKEQNSGSTKKKINRKRNNEKRKKGNRKTDGAQVVPRESLFSGLSVR